MSVEVEWWKRACEESPHAIAFVGVDDTFIYVNNAWCKLCGWAAAQLIKQKTWQDITLQEDIGSDQVSAEGLKAGTDEEYYLEKEYVSPTGQRRGVGLYVRRHPPFGPHEGFIVFATPLNSREQEALRRAYVDLKSSVSILEEQQNLSLEQQRGFQACQTELEYVKQDVQEIKESQRHLTDRIDQVLTATIKDGDNITLTSGNEHVGRDKTTNSTILVMVVAATLVGMGTVLFGGKFAFDYMKRQVIIESQQNQTPVKIEVNE